MAKGHYFSLNRSQRKISHLIYPLPQIGGLGVHLTLDLAGEVRFGPDVHWIERENYEVPESLRCVSMNRLSGICRGFNWKIYNLLMQALDPSYTDPMKNLQIF
jgi:L-2-hydroxyglutarate oxidase LhgO